jgi:hypothetical protein
VLPKWEKRKEKKAQEKQQIGRVEIFSAFSTVLYILLGWM